MTLSMLLSDCNLAAIVERTDGMLVPVTYRFSVWPLDRPDFTPAQRASSATLSLAAAASAPLRTMSQKVSPGAWCVIMAIFRRGVLAVCGAAAPAAAGAWVGCDGAPPALQAMATEASPPAHAKNIVRLMPTPS